jgi:hypothetical protein
MSNRSRELDRTFKRYAIHVSVPRVEENDHSCHVRHVAGFVPCPHGNAKSYSKPCRGSFLMSSKCARLLPKVRNPLWVCSARDSNRKASRLVGRISRHRLLREGSHCCCHGWRVHPVLHSRVPKKCLICQRNVGRQQVFVLNATFETRRRRYPNLGVLPFLGRAVNFGVLSNNVREREGV